MLWLRGAQPIQSLAQAGITHSNDPQTGSGSRGLRAIAGEILARYTSISEEILAQELAAEQG